MHLTHETLRHTFEQGLEAYEFLGIDAAWEHLWTDHTHSYVFPRFYPYSGRGMLGLGTDVPRFVFRKFMHSIKNPPTLFRASTIRGKGK